MTTTDGSPSDPHGTFRVGAGSRWLHAVTLAVLVAMTTAMAGAAGWSSIVAVFIALTGVEAMNTISLWRWHVTADAAGVTVQQGLRAPQHLPWETIAGVRRTLPPTVELIDGGSLRLGSAIPRGLLRRAAQHIDAHAANQPDTGS